MVSIDEGKNIDNAVAIAYDENERRMSMFIFFTHKLERSNLCVLDKLNEIAGEELFGFCFDVGHVNVTRGNMYHAIVTMGKRIKVLHVHDNMGVTDQHFGPYMGNVNWEDFIRGMRDIGYEGDLSFETFRVLFVFPKELAKSCVKLLADTGRYLIRRIEEQ